MSLGGKAYDYHARGPRINTQLQAPQNVAQAMLQVIAVFF